MATMDVLKALDELKDAGVEERSARAMIRLVSDAVEVQAVTKVDLEREGTAIRAAIAQSAAELRGEASEFQEAIKRDNAELRGEAAGFRETIERDIAGLRSELAGFRETAERVMAELRQDMAGLRTDVTREIAGLRVEMLRQHAAIQDSFSASLLTTVGLQFGGTALLLGAFYALLR